MTASIATLAYSIGIVGLFVLDRDREARSSKALWIPVVWLWIVGSREVSQWLAIAGVGSGVSSDPETYLEGNAVDRAVYTALVLLGLIVLAGRGPQVTRLLRANVPILLFFIYCLASVLWSDYTLVALKRWIKAVGDPVMVLIVISERDWVAALKRFLARAAFLLIPLSVLFIKYYPALAVEYKRWSGKGMYSGITTTKNLLGAICLIFGLGSLWRLLAACRDRRGSHRIRHLIVHGTVVLMAFWLLLLCDSMTSLVCLVLSGGFLALTSLSPLARRRSVVHALTAAVVSASFAALFLGSGASALETIGRDATLTGRTAIWTLVLSLSGNPVLGTGFESFWMGERLMRVWSVMPGIQEAHNGYIEVYLNLGWIGIALLAVIIVKGYVTVVSALRLHPDVGSLQLAYFVAAVIYGFTEAGFRMLFIVWLFFLVAIMADPEKCGSPLRAGSGLLPSRAHDTLWEEWIRNHGPADTVASNQHAP